jgi:HEAT repeat protein
MQSFTPLLAALLVVSNVSLADPPADASLVTQISGESDPRIYLAQASTSEARSSKTDAEKRKTERAPTDDEALALAALEGLMAQPAERALPILKKVLSGPQSALVKRRALFVLSQIHEPEAQTILLETTKSADPSLRAEAIRNIGIGGDPKSLGMLQEMYTNGDRAVKQQVLEAWLISGSKNEVYQAALNAKTDEDANDAIRMLGAMGAAEELRKLGDLKKPGHELTVAYAIAGDLTSLRKIAEGKGDVDTRSEAVRKIGIVHTDEARKALRDIYASATDEEIKRAALEGMLIGGDEQGVLALYRSAQGAEEKRALLRTLSHMNGDAALQAIDAALEPKK